MPLRIGFDLDGTVADMYSALRVEAIKLFGEDVVAKSTIREVTSGPAGAEDASKEPVPDEAISTANLAMDDLHLTARQQMQLWDHVKKIEDFWMTLAELEPGIIARIAHAATTRQWEIIFLTTRPSTAGTITQLQSQCWLDAHGFRYPSVMVVQRSRGKIADALQLDAFVDDRPENCLDIAVESKAKAILVWHGHLKDVPVGAKRLGVRPVSTISEALALLEQLDDIRRKPGIVRRIKKVLGRDDVDG